MGDERADRIRRQLEAITPGPWSQGMVGDHLIAEVDYSAAFGFVKVDAHLSDDGNQGRSDAAFIADAPDNEAWLLAALDEARTENGRLREALTQCVAAMQYSEPLNTSMMQMAWDMALTRAQMALASPDRRTEQ